MFNTFLKAVFAARVDRSKIESALERVSQDLSVTVDGTATSRLLFFKFESSDEVSDVYNLSCKLCENVIITNLGVNPKNISTSQISDYKINIGKVIVTDNNVEVFVSNEMLVDKFELNYISQLIQFVRVKLSEYLDIPVQFTGITNIEDEVYKDKEGQYRSTEYGYFIKAVFETIRSRFLVGVTDKLMNKFPVEKIVTKFNQDTIFDQFDLLISEYIDSDDFDTMFSKSLHELFSLSKVIDINEFIDEAISKSLDNSKFSSKLDEFFNKYNSQESLDINKGSDTYTAGLNCISIFYEDVFKKISNKFNEEIRNKRQANNQNSNLYKQIFAVSKEELEDIYETVEKAKKILDGLTGEARARFFTQCNNYIETVVEDEQAKAELKQSIKESGQEAKKEQEKEADETSYSEVSSQIVSYIEDYNVTFTDGKYFWNNPDTNEREETTLDTIRSIAENDLKTSVDENLLDTMIKTDPTAEVPSGYTEALQSDKKYRSFKKRAEDILNQLINLNNELDNIIESNRNDYKIIKEKAWELLFRTQNLPTDILNILKSALKNGPKNPVYAIEYLKAVLVVQTDIAKTFTEELDYKSAVNKIRGILNTGKALENYYNLKSPMTISEPTDKKALPGSNISYAGTYYKDQVLEILNNVEDTAFKNAIENLQNSIDKTREYVENTNI